MVGTGAAPLPVTVWWTKSWRTGAKIGDWVRSVSSAPQADRGWTTTPGVLSSRAPIGERGLRAPRPSRATSPRLPATTSPAAPTAPSRSTSRRVIGIPVLASAGGPVCFSGFAYLVVARARGYLVGSGGALPPLAAMPTLLVREPGATPGTEPKYWASP